MFCEQLNTCVCVRVRALQSFPACKQRPAQWWDKGFDNQGNGSDQAKHKCRRASEKKQKRQRTTTAPCWKSL